MRRVTIYILFSLSCCFVKADTDVPNHEMVPGIIISHSPASSGRYIGCPSIAVLPNGNYVASHSFFGFGSQNSKSAIYLSQNRGTEWTKQTEIKQWWSTLFVHNNLLYIIGVDGIYGNITIRRSEDGGTSWSTPISSHSGLLLNGHYHCAPVPVVIHKGRIWRAFEKQNDGGWADKFSVFVMSAPVDADLLKAENWTSSNMIHWENWGSYKGWLEGNIVVSTDDKLVNILRVHEPNFGGKAAVVHISDDGKEITFDPHKDFIDLPGGCKKFTIRYDSESRQYWSLSNWVHTNDKNFPNKNFVRNTLALITSENLTNWEVRSVIMNYRDVHKTGFQYVDWLIEGDDMITVSRTAFDDGLDGANNAHDANYLTFHRIPDFRDRNIESKTLHNQNIDLLIEKSSQLTEGWKYSEWLGLFFPTDSGWLYHSKIGWLYAITQDFSSTWLFNPSLLNSEQHSGKWIWTNDEVFPFLYMQINHVEPSYQLLDSYPWTWTYIDLKTNRKERFYDYSSSSWLNLE